MRTFTVHASTSTGAPLRREDERVRFVKEGIAWWALIGSFFWFLYHRMWWEAAFIFGLSALIGLAGEIAELENLFMVVGLLFQILVAVEANDLRRMALARKAYRVVAVVHGVDEAEAELRFFTDWTGTLPAAHDFADIGAPTSAVFDRRGESRGFASLTAGSRDPIWPKSKTPETADLAASSDADVLGLFPKPLT